MPQPLTDVERDVYTYLLDFLSEHTYQPSVREIGARFGIKSTKTVSQILHAIARKGYIEIDPARSRGVRLLGFASTRRVQPVPCFERLAAEGPALRTERRGRYITLDRCFVPANDVFFVRASDDAMQPCGVMHGDWVLVRPGVPAADGDGDTLVAARLGEGAVIRTLVTHGALRTLVPSAAGVPVLPVAENGDGTVLGEVCAVLRPPKTIGH
jgi:repressor LexA